MKRREFGPAGRRTLSARVALFFGAAVLWLAGTVLQARMIVWTAVLLLAFALLLRWLPARLPGADE